MNTARAPNRPNTDVEAPIEARVLLLSSSEPRAPQSPDATLVPGAPLWT